MSSERVARILRPSLALVALAVALVVAGGLLTAPARATGSSALPSATPSTPAFDTSKADEPVVQAGEDVIVPAGTSTQSVVAAGGDVTVDGSVAGPVVAFGGDVAINGSVKTSVVAFGGDITVRGYVGASLVAFGGDVTLLPSAVVGTSMKSQDKTVVLFGGALTRDPSAQVTGAAAIYDNANWSDAATWIGSRVGTGVIRPWWGFSLLGWIVQMGIFLVLGLVAAALMPKQMRAVQRQLAGRTAASLGWGALAFFIIVPAVLVVLVISVVGLLLVLPYAVVVPLFYFFVITTVAAFVAGRLLAGTKHRDNLMLAVVIGVVATTIVSRIPVAGALTLIVMAVFGAGAAVLAFGDWRRARRAATAVAPAPAGGPAGPAPYPGGGAPYPGGMAPAAAGVIGAGAADAYLPQTPPLPPPGAEGGAAADATGVTTVPAEAATAIQPSDGGVATEATRVAEESAMDAAAAGTEATPVTGQPVEAAVAEQPPAPPVTPPAPAEAPAPVTPPAPAEPPAPVTPPAPGAEAAPPAAPDAESAPAPGKDETPPAG